MTLSFDYDEVTDAEKLKVVSPAGKIEFTVEKLTVLEERVYAVIVITKAHSNAVATLEL